MLACALVLSLPGGVLAGHLWDWRHDHSSSGVPYRPQSLWELKQRFGGEACNDSANDARTWFPHAVARWQGGYVYYHPYLARNIGYNIRTHIAAVHKDNAIDYGVYGYVCKYKSGGGGRSTHSWGAAVDTNTARNPLGQTYWNGYGADGANHGYYIPNVWRGDYPGHNFYWGLNWNDPHHFQYVTNY